jgi:hypothetical protein
VDEAKEEGKERRVGARNAPDHKREESPRSPRLVMYEERNAGGNLEAREASMEAAV